MRLAAVALLSMLVIGSPAVATFPGDSPRTSEVVRGSVIRLRIILRAAIPAPSTARYLGIVGADSAGKSLDGKSCYRLHFASADVPPRDTEWSLALYPTNPFHSPTLLGDQWVGSNSHLSYNPDGSLDIAIQRKRPKGAENANWLPAPDGRFNLIIRASSHRAQPIDVDWQVPRPRRLDP
jgi:hypothetical protein